MKHFVAKVLVGVALCLGLLVPPAGKLLAAADPDEPALLQANRALEKAIGSGDRAPLTALLDEDFLWTSLDGRTHSKEEMISNLPKAVVSSADSGAQVTEHSYGPVALLLVHSANGNAHTLSVYVKRSGGWRLLLMNEIADNRVSQPWQSAGADDDPNATTRCVHACQIFPFQPLTAAENAAIFSWQNQPIATGSNDPERFDRFVGDEWVSYGNAGGTVTKAEEMATLTKARQGGDLGRFKGNPPPDPILGNPPPVKWGRLWDFGSVVVMLDRDPARNGTLSSSTRVWVNKADTYQCVVAFHMSAGRDQ
jgi:hypothetical protein